jgi:hypothetical protein
MPKLRQVNKILRVDYVVKDYADKRVRLLPPVSQSGNIPQINFPKRKGNYH